MTNEQPTQSPKLVALDFFAGSGLVSHALKPSFKVLWANDISPQKAAVYCANHPARHFHLADLGTIAGTALPEADLSWASFPCQDLSLAGNGQGIYASRSGLVWQWLRVMDEMHRPPDLLAAENVEGLLTTHNGQNYLVLHRELVRRGYRVGAIRLDASRFLPQSRPRVFVIALRAGICPPESLTTAGPGWLHPASVRRLADRLEDWVWWSLPKPPKRRRQLADLIEWDAPTDPPEKTARLLDMLSDRHRTLLAQSDASVLPGYKRTRSGAQRLELRFDGLAGCLRTPAGGSSRQVLVLRRDGQLSTRLLTARESALLMGAPPGYRLPERYSDAYMAMGDAVAAPAVHYLARHLLEPLARAARLARETPAQSTRKELPPHA